MHSCHLRLLPAIVAVPSVFIAFPAQAHHPMGGAVPTEAWQGLLSGLAHPVIGPDHLAFLLAAALLVAWSGVRGWRSILLTAAFVGAGAVGTLLRRPWLELPFAEFGVALSLLVLATALILQRRTQALWPFGFALIAGGLHGWAYGEAVLGAEPTPLVAYVVALAVAQAGLLALTHQVGAWSLRVAPMLIPRARQVVSVLSASVGLLAMSGVLPA